MRSSALQLRHYIITELSLAANRAFDPEKKVQLGLHDVLGKPECRVDQKDPQEWQIVLKLKHSQSTESNSPYFFMIAMVGFFAVDKSVPEAKVAEFVEVNGASVLYSTAREVMRSLMAMGPYRPILLPTVCFYNPKPPAGEKKAGTGEAPKAAELPAPAAPAAAALKAPRGKKAVAKA